MFKYYFERIQDIEVFPLISLMIFFLFFVTLLIWVVRADKGYIAKMSGLPIDETSIIEKEKANSAIGK